jgi:glyoxylase-like metal-dependent hydrolase (beta-lactamase superfamily II)
VIRVGAIEVTPLSDGELRVPPDELLQGPGWPEGFLEDDGLLAVNFGGYLVRTPDRIIVVDTGIGGGALPELPIGSFPDELARAGVRPEDVEDVIFTHLHFDHVGWSTDGVKPFFVNARHHCHPLDWDYWCGPDPAPETGPGREELGAIPAPRRLAPLELQAHDGELAPGVTLRHARGHSPGHCIVQLDSEGERMLLLADAAHNPAQLLSDDWTSATDVDPELARVTRAALARELRETGALAAMTHHRGIGRLGDAGWTPYAPSIE